MTPEEFLEKVVCPICQTKINNKPPFQNGLVCNCRCSRQVIVKPSYNNSGDLINYTFKLFLTKEIMMVVQIYYGQGINPHFYIASEDRPFYPLYECHHIPDYIFLPLPELISKLELYATFS